MAIYQEKVIKLYIFLMTLVMMQAEGKNDLEKLLLVRGASTICYFAKTVNETSISCNSSDWLNASRSNFSDCLNASRSKSTDFGLVLTSSFHETFDNLQTLVQRMHERQRMQEMQQIPSLSEAALLMEASIWFREDHLLLSLFGRLFPRQSQELSRLNWMLEVVRSRVSDASASDEELEAMRMSTEALKDLREAESLEWRVDEILNGAERPKENNNLAQRILSFIENLFTSTGDNISHLGDYNSPPNSGNCSALLRAGIRLFDALINSGLVLDPGEVGVQRFLVVKKKITERIGECERDCAVLSQERLDRYLRLSDSTERLTELISSECIANRWSWLEATETKELISVWPNESRFEFNNSESRIFLLKISNYSCNGAESHDNLTKSQGFSATVSVFSINKANPSDRLQWIFEDLSIDLLKKFNVTEKFDITSSFKEQSFFSHENCVRKCKAKGRFLQSGCFCHLDQTGIYLDHLLPRYCRFAPTISTIEFLASMDAPGLIESKTFFEMTNGYLDSLPMASALKKAKVRFLQMMQESEIKKFVILSYVRNLFSSVFDEALEELITQQIDVTQILKNITHLDNVKELMNELRFANVNRKWENHLRLLHDVVAGFQNLTKKSPCDLDRQVTFSSYFWDRLPEIRIALYQLQRLTLDGPVKFAKELEPLSCDIQSNTRLNRFRYQLIRLSFASYAVYYWCSNKFPNNVFASRARVEEDAITNKAIVANYFARNSCPAFYHPELNGEGCEANSFFENQWAIVSCDRLDHTLVSAVDSKIVHRIICLKINQKMQWNLRPEDAFCVAPCVSRNASDAESCKVGEIVRPKVGFRFGDEKGNATRPPRCEAVFNDGEFERKFDSSFRLVDINECQEERSPCGTDQTCHNTVGSYRCDCPHGFRPSGLNCLCNSDSSCPNYQRCSYGHCIDVCCGNPCNEWFLVCTHSWLKPHRPDCVKWFGYCENDWGYFYHSNCGEGFGYSAFYFRIVCYCKNPMASKRWGCGRHEEQYCESVYADHREAKRDEPKRIEPKDC